MLKISIIDDDKNDIKMVESAVDEALARIDIKADVALYESALSFLKEDNNESDLAFVDIDMPEMCGIRLKEELEKKLWSVRVVYVTSHMERMAEAFGKNVYGYEKKPLCIDDAIKYIKIAKNEKHTSQMMIFCANRNIFRTEKKKIVALRADGKYSRLYLTDNSLLIDDSINKIEDELCDDTFIKVHRSFIVNLAYVKTISDQIELENGMKVPYSRSNKELVFNTYRKYCEGLI